MKSFFIILCIICASVANLVAQRPMTVEDMWSMKRISSVSLSPDGKNIIYSQSKYDMDENSGHTEIWLMPAAGGTAKQLTNHSASSHSPQWMDDKRIAFLAARNSSTQIFILDLNGGEAMQLTDFPVDVESFVIGPKGNRIAFTATVYADAETLQESADRDEAKEESPVKARIIDDLLYRHWNRWTDGKHTHVFVCDMNGENVIDLTPGAFDAPPLDLGSANDISFSPDGTELAFVSNHTDMPAANTNNDIFLVPVTGGQAECLTKGNEGVDNQPLYSPDGRFIAYRAMKRAGFEADQYEIILYDRREKTRKSLTEGFDRTPAEMLWSPKSDKIYFNAEDEGRERIFVVDVKTQQVDELVSDHVNTQLAISADAKKLYFRQQSNVQPYEIFSFDLKKKEGQQLSFVNKSLLAKLEMNPINDFWFDSFDGKKVHGMMVKPPKFDAAKKYPMMLLIHGGPQGMWSDDFHYRWNSSMFAAPGYVVVMINVRGSKGYGQDWCDAVTKNWGGGPYEDLMAGVDYVLETFNFIDDNKLAAAGASYGGYMINWIATQTDRFDVLVSHAGVFDIQSKYGSTEELWFPEWEFGGTPYENPELYEKWSPSTYVKNFETLKTPTLVIHGQHDYRVPVSQAFQMFTALQRMEVPSRFLYFPDETHFISKPQNARLWWSEIFAWVDQWINP